MIFFFFFKNCFCRGRKELTLHKETALFCLSPEGFDVVFVSLSVQAAVHSADNSGIVTHDFKKCTQVSICSVSQFPVSPLSLHFETFDEALVRWRLQLDSLTARK